MVGELEQLCWESWGWSKPGEGSRQTLAVEGVS